MFTGQSSKRTSRHSLRRKDTLTRGKEQYGGLYDDWIEAAGLGSSTYVPSTFEMGATRKPRDSASKVVEGHSVTPRRKKPVIFGGSSGFSSTSFGSNLFSAHVTSHQQPQLQKAYSREVVDIVTTPRNSYSNNSVMSPGQAMTSSTSSVWHHQMPGTSSSTRRFNSQATSPQKKQQNVRSSTISPWWLQQDDSMRSSFTPRNSQNDQNSNGLLPAHNNCNGYFSENGEHSLSVVDNANSLELRGSNLKLTSYGVDEGVKDNKNAHKNRIKAKMADIELL